MSAICGIYKKTGAMDMREAESVLAELGKYRFDKTGSYREGSVFMGCHVRFVSPESLHETLPYEDREAELVITADAAIYNREELFSLLPAANENRNMPDGLLILEAYKKWGQKCPEMLIGDFAFAVWDRRKNELFCARDHTGNRTLYYYHAPDIFAFSTLIEPLFQIKTVQRKLNDVYIADFLSIVGVRSELGDEMTIYEQILYLPPASAMVVGKGGVRKWRYWEIRRTKPIRYATDAEYEAAFREVYSEAVRCRLRCVRKIGISLSGGLDSGSVACLAAAELKKRGETLYSFTQVPIREYRDWLPKNYMADESGYAAEICAYAGNMEPRRIMAEGRHPLTEIKESLKFKESPYKNTENSYWLNEIARIAAGIGIGVLMSGQFGNATVSWGKFERYMIYLLKSMRMRTFFREINARSAVTGTSPSRILRQTVQCLIPFRLQRYQYLKKGGKDHAQLLSPVNPAFFREMKTGKRIRKRAASPQYYTADSSYTLRMKLLGFPRLSHSGATKTKMSLAFGLEMRDPTKDKRLIEFCMNLPENQWVRCGEDRRLIRHAMAGHMPDSVRLNTTVRGRQAADWMQRITPEEWAAARAEMETIGEHALERKYLDVPRIKRLLKENEKLSPDDHTGTESGVRLLIRALIFTRFLRSVE